MKRPLLDPLSLASNSRVRAARAKKHWFKHNRERLRETLQTQVVREIAAHPQNWITIKVLVEIAMIHVPGFDRGSRSQRYGRVKGAIAQLIRDGVWREVEMKTITGRTITRYVPASMRGIVA